METSNVMARQDIKKARGIPRAFEGDKSSRARSASAQQHTGYGGV